MEIKYDAVFGPQELFDGMMGDCEFASEEYGYMFAKGALYYCERYNEKAGWSLSCKSNLTFKPSAMRRIIRTPTWNIADQKAGKLPEVGCRVNFCYKLNTNWRTGEIRYIDDQCAVIKADDIDRPFAYEVDRVEFKPIESPEEKAARLRSEWCIKALSSCSILSEMQKYELKRLGGYIEDIYDALLSGDLPVPVKE